MPTEIALYPVMYTAGAVLIIANMQAKETKYAGWQTLPLGMF